jgi:hypothetical protein
MPLLTTAAARPVTKKSVKHVANSGQLLCTTACAKTRMSQKRVRAKPALTQRAHPSREPG